MDHKVTATCIKGVSLTVEQQLWEFDGYTPPAYGGGTGADYQGYRRQTRSFSHYGGTIEFHVTRTLDKTDFDAYEEPYQNLRFRVVIIDTGRTSGWSNWEATDYRQILY